MRIYLAARYSRHSEMQTVAADLAQLGHIVTSRWIHGGHLLLEEGSAEQSAADRRRLAQEDLDDLVSADWVISFTEEPRSTRNRGGRHVEFGMAFALGRRVFVVGYRENVFHYLPRVEFFETWDALLETLRDR